MIWASAALCASYYTTKIRQPCTASGVKTRRINEIRRLEGSDQILRGPILVRDHLQKRDNDEENIIGEVWKYISA